MQKPEILPKMPEVVRNAVKLFLAEKVVVVKPEVVLYFGLLLVKSEFGVIESEKWVVAIFVLPVWPLDPRDALFCLILACIVAVSHIDG